MRNWPSEGNGLGIEPLQQSQMENRLSCKPGDIRRSWGAGSSGEKKEWEEKKIGHRELKGMSLEGIFFLNTVFEILEQI